MFCFEGNARVPGKRYTWVDTYEFKKVDTYEERMKKHLPSRKQKKTILDLSLKEPDITVKPLHFNDEKI